MLPTVPISRASVPSLISLIGAVAMGCGGSATGSSPPACVATASSVPSPASVVSGTISGPGISADICSGDTFAYLETGGLTVINGGFDPGGVRFTIPSDAVSGGLASYFRISAVKSGAGSSTNGDCGSVAFCAMLPTPTTLDCGDGVANCPPGCAPQGPSSRGSVSAGGADKLLRGHERVRLSDVEDASRLVDADPHLGRSVRSARRRVAGESRSEVHGTVSATLEPDPPDATKAPATLRLNF